MSNSLLVSKEWCDLVFEHRNKRYGAYLIRKQAGRRYRLVALIFAGILVVLLGVAGAVGYFVYRAVQETAAELEQVVKLRPLKAEKGFEVKRISTGRRAVAVKATPGASNAMPEIVDRRTISVPMGINGVTDAATLEEASLRDEDLTHNADQKDLPIEGAQLVKTERVEELPIFPGGVQALMQYMDSTVLYSGAAQRRKAEGDVLVAFIVETDGSVGHIEVEKKADDALNRAVVTAVRRMPKWKPGRRNGQPLPVKISIPIHFQLQ
ncbi:MAG: energy transducer TonB [Alloprevotella sp.]